MQCIDPADGSRLIVRLVPCNHEDDVTFLTSEASDIRDNFHPNLLHMTGVHHHLVSPDDLARCCIRMPHTRLCFR